MKDDNLLLNLGPDSFDDRWQYGQVGDNMKNDDLANTRMSGCDDAMQIGSNGDIEMSIGDASNVQNPCTLNKRGYCVEHKTKGDRSEVKYRAWRKKKYGYGYVT